MRNQDIERLLSSRLTEENIQQILEWSSKAPAEAYMQYVRRLLKDLNLRNLKDSENSFYDKLLKQEILTKLHKPIHVDSFVEAVVKDSDIAKHFELSSFLDHYNIEEQQACLFAVALLCAPGKLGTSEESMIQALAKRFQSLVRQIGLHETAEELTPEDVALLARHLLLDSGCSNVLSGLQKFVIEYAIFQRYPEELPVELLSFFEAYNSLRYEDDKTKSLAQLFDETRGAAATTATSVQQVFHRRRIKPNSKGIEPQITELILTLVSTGSARGVWNGVNLGKFVHTFLPDLNWSIVMHDLDHETFEIESLDEFELLMAILKGAMSVGANIPIQFFWDSWRNTRAQASLLRQLTHAPVSVFNITDYGGPTVLCADNYVGAASNLKNLAAQLETSPWNSLELLQTSLRLLSDEAAAVDTKQFLEAAGKLTPELIFLGCIQLPQPWGAQQEQLSEKGFEVFFGGQPNHQLVFFRLWQVDPEFLCKKFVEYHNKDSQSITRILDIAHDLRILDQLLNLQPYSFVLDLAALASCRDYLNIDKWLDHHISTGQDKFIEATLRYLAFKAEAENILQQSEGAVMPITVALRVETVAIFLKALMNSAMSSENGEFLKQVQSSCLQVYPRLMNSTNANRESLDFNNFAKDVEKEVEYYYGRLYEGEMSIANFVDMLHNLKSSTDTRDQDVFACMLHSLFDEYRFFADYPLSALNITAVLFGSLIQNQLLAYIPLGISLRYILDAVAHEPESNMFKFGVQALSHFQDRVPAWPQYCQQILAVPSLVEYEPDLIQAIRNGEQSKLPTIAKHNGDDIRPPQAGILDRSSGVTPVFRALSSGANFRDHSQYADPAMEVCDKILFNMNNMSLTNLSEKLKEVKTILEPRYYGWFANHLVSQRAAVEPNYHSLYIHFLEAMESDQLMYCILQETIDNIALLLNSQNTITSTVERTNLKNLGSWLGGITLSRNQPLRHKTISLKDLLLEGLDENRLIVVLPFVCRVLEQCIESKVFKPPCPWTMAVLSLLIELYESADMKLNLKFEVEVLCKKLNLAMNEVPASSILSNRPVVALELESQHRADEVDEFLSRDEILRRGFGENDLDQSTSFVASAVAEMPIIIHPVILQNFAVPNLQRLLLIAAERAIREFILPVVERSVAVASISTSQLVSKDFALEEDVNKFRRAAHTMNQNLAGTLALVTCKEPLRGAFSTNIRILLAQSGFEGLSSEGETLLSQLISDNLDAACMIVEKAACERAISEIDEGLSAGYQARRKHLESHSGSRFTDVHAPRHAFPLPDPLRIKSTGLTADQISTYEDFARIPRTAQEAALYYSKDDSRSTIPEQETVFYTNDQISAETFDQILTSLVEVDTTARELDLLSLEEVSPDSTLRASLQRIPLYLSTLAGSIRDERTLTCSQRVCQLLFKIPYNELAAQCLTLLLNHFVELSMKTFRDVSLWLVHSEDPRKYNVPVIYCLMRAQIIVPSEFDVQLAKRIDEGIVPAIEFAISLVHETVFGNIPVALHSDFISCLEALDRISEIEEHSELAELFQQLHTHAKLPDFAWDPSLNDRAVREQLSLIFMEWVHLVSHPATSEKIQLAYVIQLQNSGITTNEDISSLFFRCMIEQGIESAARMQHIVLPNATTAHYLVVDAVAKLILMMVKFQSLEERHEIIKDNFRRFLTIITLIMHHEHDISGTNFHQRTFFRLFTSLLSEINSESHALQDLEHHLLSTFCEVMVVLQPLHAPGFTFQWITLISHRMFMPKLLSVAEETSWPQYCDLLIALLKYLAPSLQGFALSETSRVIYNSVLRILLVLLNDFPGLLDEFHHDFMSVIPEGCVQLRNLVLSSFPRKMLLPDPFLPGLKVDRLPETAHAPRIRADLEQILSIGKVLSHVHNYIYSMNPTMIPKIVKSLARRPEDVSDELPDSVLLNTLVLHCGSQAMKAVKGPPIFEVNSPWVSLLHELFRSLGPAGRYKMLGGIANQLRYPNSHTYFFSCVLLLLFSNGGDQEALVKEQITRVLLERLICNRPHPWGLLITFTELLKNSKYGFWELKFIRTSPEIETLFQSLFQHINQNIIDANTE